MIEQLPAHSPLGASGAHRWMECPGSVSLSAGVEDEESEHAALGTFAHFVGAKCLEADTAAWQMIGEPVSLFLDNAVDREMADAVDFYLTRIREWHPDRNQGNSFVERQFHCPTLHPMFYGTADFVSFDHAAEEIHVWDYKHGAGIVVDAPWNPQLMYYAVGALTDLDLWDSVENVVLHIVQPRGFHHAGPHRYWVMSVERLERWRDDVLLPAMELAMVSRDTKSGEHCRFCPARSRACPQLVNDMNELEKIMETAKEKGGAAELTNDQVDRLYRLYQLAKIVGRAAEKTIKTRLEAGATMDSAKLVQERKNREWKDGTEDAAKKKFGKQAYETKLRSPAKMEELIEGEKFAKRWAYKPPGGLTVAPATDSRRAVDVTEKSGGGFKKVNKKEKAK